MVINYVVFFLFRHSTIQLSWLLIVIHMNEHIHVLLTNMVNSKQHFLLTSSAQWVNLSNQFIDGSLVTCFFFRFDVYADLGDVSDKTSQISKSETTIKTPEIEKSSTKLEKILSHDSLTPEQIEELRQKNSQEHGKLSMSELFSFSIQILFSWSQNWTVPRQKNYIHYSYYNDRC